MQWMDDDAHQFEFISRGNMVLKFFTTDILSEFVGNITRDSRLHAIMIKPNSRTSNYTVIFFSPNICPNGLNSKKTIKRVHKSGIQERGF